MKKLLIAFLDWILRYELPELEDDYGRNESEEIATGGYL